MNIDTQRNKSAIKSTYGDFMLLAYWPSTTFTLGQLYRPQNYTCDIQDGFPKVFQTLNFHTEKDIQTVS